MISIKANGNSFVVSGEFNFGYMGVYRDNQISLLGEVNEVREWNTIAKHFNSPKECSPEKLAEFLTDYFNEFEKRIIDNKKQLNDNFLVKVFADMEARGNAFWEIDEVTISDLVPKEPDETVFNNNVVSDLSNEYKSTVNNGSVKKSDAELSLREAFPMFKFDVFLNNIEPEYVGLSDECVSFQCSDKFDEQILCGAYDELDESLTFTDWYNF